MRLQGKRALVTGASSGIGRAVAKALAMEGVHLALQGRDEARLAAVQAAAAADGFAPLRILADLTVEQAAEDAVDRAAQGLGGLDFLIHCAGISQADNPPFERTDTDAYHRIMRTNADATLFCMRRALRYVREAEAGYLVNILSTAATAAGAGGGVYAASKHAAKALQEALAAECRGTTVRVSSVSPGPVDTEIWSHKAEPPPAARRERMLRPEEIAEVVLFLLRQPPGVFIPDIRVEPWFYRK